MIYNVPLQLLKTFRVNAPDFLEARGVFTYMGNGTILVLSLAVTFALWLQQCLPNRPEYTMLF